jgi:hypothetical protein
MKRVDVRRTAIAVMCGLLCAVASAPAFAYGQDGLFGGRPNPDGSVTINAPTQTLDAPDRAQSVLQHPHLDYDPQPIRLGSFLVSPLIEAGVAYNSNIYSTPKPATSDEIIAVHPEVTAISDWSRHMISVTGSGDFDNFQQHTGQNITDAVFEASGRYDLMNQTWLAGQGGYQARQIPRANLNNSEGTKPVTYNLYSGGVSAYRGVGIIQALVDYTFNRYDYGSTNNAAAAGSLNVSELNRDINIVGGKLSYAKTQDFRPYVSMHYNTRSYASGGTGTSHGYKADVGTEWDLGGITSIDLYTGWINQEYPSFIAASANQALDFGGKLTWNVTGLTTVVLDASRSIEDSDIVGYDSFIASGGSATVTHELRRNVLLEGDAAYTNNNYRGSAPRQDHLAVVGAGTRYLINRFFYTDVNYSMTHRSSTVEGEGFVDHLVMAKLGVRF